jgi:hypothetical protein
MRIALQLLGAIIEAVSDECTEWDWLCIFPLLHSFLFFQCDSYGLLDASESVWQAQSPCSWLYALLYALVIVRFMSGIISVVCAGPLQSSMSTEVILDHLCSFVDAEQRLSC